MPITILHAFKECLECKLTLCFLSVRICQHLGRNTDINVSKNPMETGQTEVVCEDKNKKKNSATGDGNVSCSNGH